MRKASVVLASVGLVAGVQIAFAAASSAGDPNLPKPKCSDSVETQFPYLSCTLTLSTGDNGSVGAHTYPGSTSNKYTTGGGAGYCTTATSASNPFCATASGQVNPSRTAHPGAATVCYGPYYSSYCYTYNP